jgi:ubiquinone biosynthesis protein UbiJ
MLPDPATAPAHLANRLLVDQRWARDKLAPFAGRTFSLTVGPLHAGWRINENGLFDPLPAAAVVDLALTLSPWSVPSFLANPTRWNEFVHEEGDVALGGTLKELAQTLPWFVEETFASRLGPLAGQRVANTGRRLLAFPEYAAQRVTESLVSYGRDEAKLLARGDDMRRFTATVEATAAEIDALEVRIDTLAARAAAIR